MGKRQTIVPAFQGSFASTTARLDKDETTSQAGPMKTSILWSEQDDRDELDLLRHASTGQLAPALLCIEGTTARVREKTLETLNEWGERCHAALLGDGLHAQARSLARVLGRDLGLSALDTDHTNPMLSRFSYTIHERKGLPVFLAAIWMEAGTRAGVEVRGVDLPGHFIVSVGGEGGVLVDPSAGGKILSRDACRELIKDRYKHLTWREEFLEVSSTHRILKYALRHFFRHYQHARDKKRIYRAARLIAALSPHQPSARYLYARVSEAVGAHLQAVDLYEEVMIAFPESNEATRAATQLGPLLSRTRMLN